MFHAVVYIQGLRRRVHAVLSTDLACEVEGFGVQGAGSICDVAEEECRCIGLEWFEVAISSLGFRVQCVVHSRQPNSVASVHSC